MKTKRGMSPVQKEYRKEIENYFDMVMVKMREDKRVKGFQMTEVAINFHLAGLLRAISGSATASRAIGIPLTFAEGLRGECVTRIQKLKLGGTE